MKKSKVRIIIMLVLLAVTAIAGTMLICMNSDKYDDATVVLYDGPETLEDATPEDLENVSESARDFTLKHCVDTIVKVNGQESYVYDTNVNHTRTWYSDYEPPQSRTPITYFDFEGEVEIEVTVPEQDLEKVTISPLSVQYIFLPIL